ncbi:MAG: hypothetical protein Q7T80_08420, partial [Methanoregula sp.]|nr:hypothetical protein [Methanoregula sp.]
MHLKNNYPQHMSGMWMVVFLNGQRFVWMVIVLAVSFVFFTPVASALLENADIPHSTGPLDKDNPEELSLLKSHTAYVGVMQQARMNGVIGYIDRISNGAGTANLQWIQEDYIAAASSIPLLYTSDEITAAREEMRTQSIRFFEETNIQLAAFNGTNTDLRASTKETEEDAETKFARMPDS